ADIVAKAGHRAAATRGDKRPRGNVTIATNMAGRGTDIKLEAGVVFEKCIGELGPPDDAASSRKWFWHEPGVTGTKCCVHCPDYDAKTNCAHCWKPKVDPRFPALGRTVCPITVPCGLHIVGTERHESRRIDNQLRGRSGRQGDPGSSQFFLSISDELMKMFMGDRMLWLLEKFGFEEGMAIEHKSVNRAIEKAQKKVEERNFSIRKHLLEYDEVMDHQRKVFYEQRQAILERRGLTELIWKIIGETIEDAVDRYLAPLYRAECAAEWVRGKLDCALEPKKLDLDDRARLEAFVRDAARDEARSQIAITVGEYMDPDVDPAQWDIRGLVRWAESHFDAAVTQNQLRKMSQLEIQELLTEAAAKKMETFDLSPLEPFLDPNYGAKSQAQWARQKFGVEVTLDELLKSEPGQAGAVLTERVKAQYRQRELTYPVEWILDRTLGAQGADTAYAADALAAWANLKFNVGWTVDTVQNRPAREVADTLFQLNRDYVGNGKLEAEVDQAMAGEDDLRAWGARRFGRAFDMDAFDAAAGQGPDRGTAREFLLKTGRALLRHELTLLEQYVLLQIYDQTWKDHMHAMDLLKEAIGLRAYAEQDPKIAYKREGFRMFNEMMQNVREKVTSIIFRARLSDDGGMRSAYQIGRAMHEDATNLGFSGQADADREAAMRGQDGPQKIETIRRDVPRVGRNDPCPCGSGKKFKQCCGKKGAGPVRTSSAPRR
ncbi:MAG: SEC-C metal-binding domain-containing protein, partial [Phycisphaerae bacterium]